MRTITLDGRLYRADAVEAAIREYSGIADMKMEKKDGEIIVTMENWPGEYDEVIEFEFCNYLLWKMRN